MAEDISFYGQDCCLFVSSIMSQKDCAISRHYNCGPCNTVFVTAAIMVLGAGKDLG
jgi:hypothetical protein